MTLPVCEKCQSVDIIAIDPGYAGEEVDLLGTVVVVVRGIPLRAWCEEHWPAKMPSLVSISGKNEPIGNAD